MQPECLRHFFFGSGFDPAVWKRNLRPNLELGVGNSLVGLSPGLTSPKLCDRSREVRVLAGIEIKVAPEPENGGGQNLKDTRLNVLPGPDRIVHTQTFVGAQDERHVCPQKSLGNKQSHRDRKSVV